MSRAASHAVAETPIVDELTSLPGRARFFSELEKHIEQTADTTRVLGLVIVRTRKLRKVNRELGYEAGDQILREISARLARCLRPTDIMTRISGSEFALILPALIGIGQAVLAANKIGAVVREPFEIYDLTIRLRLAVGVAVYPDHAPDAKSLVARAESALSVAGAIQAGQAVYVPKKTEPQFELPLEAELETAIENGEIDVHYQPKIDLSKQVISGVEALARWVSPSQGPVRPDIFVRIAEQSGLILPLTLLTLNVSLRACRELQRAFPDFSVSVNLSPSILNEHDVDELVKRALSIWGTEANQLTLEVTEGAIMADPAASLETLRRLRSTGVRISIDDFGTGYSSLAYLKNLPVNELKIDKSFVLNMIDNHGDAKIVKSIVDLAHNFELAVVAEGIENQGTFDRLAAMGCEFAQGFYMSRPLPLDGLLAWMNLSRWGRHVSPSTSIGDPVSNHPQTPSSPNHPPL